MSELIAALTGNKRVNLKALVVLGGTLILFAGAVYLVHGYQVKRNARGLFEQAELAEREGQRDRAAEYLEQYVRLAPDDANALAKYGLMLAGEAKNDRTRVRAYLVLERVLREDRERDDVRREVVRVAIQLGRFGDAKEHLGWLLKAAPDGDAELFHLYGRCEAGLREFHKAGTWYRRAMEKDPRRAEICLEYATLLRDEFKQPTEADEVVDRLVHLDGGNPETRLHAARYFSRFAMPDRAWEHLRFALDELKATTDELLLFAAEVALSRGDTREAGRLLAEAEKLPAGDNRRSRELARLRLRRGEKELALAHLGGALLNLPKDPDELWDLGNVLIDAGQQEPVGRVIAALREAGVPAAAKLLDARLQMRKGSWGEASKTLEQVRGERSFTPALTRTTHLFRAQCYERLRNPDRQIEAYRQALDVDPRWAPARHGLAAALAASGKLDLAVVEYRKLAADYAEVRPEFARLLLVQNFRLPPPARDWAEVERALDTIAPPTQNTAEVRLLRAELLAAQDRTDEAQKLAEAERDRDRTQVGPWLLLAGLAAWKGGTRAALDVLDDAEREAGRHAEWPLARARFWLSDGADEAKKRLSKLLDRLDEYKGEELNRLLSGLADAFVAADDLPTARRLWQRLSENEADNLRVWFLLFEAALVAKETEEAQRVLGKLKELEAGEGAYGAYGEGALLMVRAYAGEKRAAEARPFLTKSATQRPSWAKPLALLAAGYELEGDREKALEQYRAALERGETRPAVVRQALQLMYAQRLYAEANAVLRKLPEQSLATPELSRLTAQVTLAGGQGEGQNQKAARQQALRLARKAVADSKDHRDYLWLGQLAALAGEQEEAEKAFRRACELNDTAPENWATLVLFLARTDVKKAEAELEQAKRQLPKDLVPLVLATCYEGMGRAEQAEQQYQAALTARPTDVLVLRSVVGYYGRNGQLAKAEPLLRKILEPTSGATETARVVARRDLAVTLAAQGGYQRFKAAQSLLAENAKSAGETLEDRRAKALVLATQPAQRREAIRLLEGLAPQQSSAPAEVRFLLAQLYEADGEWRTAESHLLGLLREQERNPLYLTRYLRGLVRRGQADKAEPWAEQLAGVAPRAPETIELRIQVLKARGRAEEAAALVREYAKGKDARLEVAAVAMERLGLDAEAEALYRAHAAASKQPESVLLIALHLARQNRVAEALEICDKAWTTGQPELVAAASVDIVRMGRTTAEQQRRVERGIVAALRTHPRSKLLPALLAGLYELQGRYDEVVPLYRATLKLDPDEVPALNNLAYLLACRRENLDEALQLINRAIALAGPEVGRLDTRALVYLEANQSDPALKDLQQAIAQGAPPAVYFHLARAQHLAKNRPAAAEAFRKARDLGLKVSDLHPLEQPAFPQLAHSVGQQ